MARGTGHGENSVCAQSRGLLGDRPTLLFSRHQLMLVANHGFDLVKLGSPDNFGLYSHGSTRNGFGTPLAARGSEAALRALLAELAS